MKYFNDSRIVKWYHGNDKISKWYQGNSKVWSGISVSYYDGEELIGTDGFSEGEDVLHPSITVPDKEDYTFCGWSLTPDGIRLTELLATDASITLYAVYLPDTLEISGQSAYLSGTLSTIARARYSNKNSNIAIFKLNKNAYENAVCTYKISHSGASISRLVRGSFSIDGVSHQLIGDTSSPYEYEQSIRSGTHMLQTTAISYDNYDEWVSIAVDSITLSDPIAWT